jgi:hypothetical protein
MKTDLKELSKVQNDLLIILSQRKSIRPSEIQKMMEPIYKMKYKLAGISSNSLAVIIARNLRFLLEQNLVKKEIIGHKNVKYKITDAGIHRLQLSEMARNIVETNSPEIQSLEFLIHTLIQIIYSQSPNEPSVEYYIDQLRQQLNDDLLMEKVKELLEHPALYQHRFYSQEISRFLFNRY